MNMRGNYIICTLAVIAYMGSCQSNRLPSEKTGNKPPIDSLSVRKELALPQVPSSLTLPSERAAYILAHYWEGLDLRDTLRSHNNGFMEQSIVNWLSLFPHADEAVLPRCVDSALGRIVKDKEAFRLFTSVVERYLNDPNSPMRNETYYILYLEGLLRLRGLPEEERLRPAYQLETARKNRPGSMATDFGYLTREGRRGRLHDTAAGSRLLLLFYDPACGHCAEILRTLQDSPVLHGLVVEKKLSVLAVYTEGDRELWKRTRGDMPAEWTVAMDTEGIVERHLYDLPAMPILYLLDTDKTVLLKDSSPTDLEAWLLMN